MESRLEDKKGDLIKRIDEWKCANGITDIQAAYLKVGIRQGVVARSDIWGFLGPLTANSSASDKIESPLRDLYCSDKKKYSEAAADFIEELGEVCRIASENVNVNIDLERGRPSRVL